MSTGVQVRFGVGVHHAAPGLPGLAVALDHSVLEEALARSDAVARQVQPVVDGEDQHQTDGQQLSRVLLGAGSSYWFDCCGYSDNRLQTLLSIPEA